jgi:outer membrane protein assembly factor BamB
MSNRASHALNQLLRLSAYMLAKLVARRTTALALVAAIALGAGVAHAEDWPSPGLDAGHARFTAERSGARFADGRWSVPGAGRVLASPVTADGFVVTADLDGTVRAVRADDGQMVWQAALRSTVQGTPAIARGRVYVPTVSNKVVALRLSDGAQLWARDVGGMTLSSPAAVNADIVVAAGFPAKTVLRLSGATGEVVWQSPPVMEQFSNTSPAVGAGLVIVGANGGRYYALDAATGALRWEYLADGLVHLAAPLIAGGRVYMAGGDQSHRVHAVDAATGAAVAGWPIQLPTAAPDIAGTISSRQRAMSSIASAGGLLLLQTRLDDAMDTNADRTADRYLSRESVLGIDPDTGAIAWERAIARAEVEDQNDVPKFFVCPTPAGYASDGGPALVAAASSLAAAVVVLDAASGAEKNRLAVAGAALASPVLANGRLITVATSGAVEGLGSSANHAPSAPILAGNGQPLDAADVTLRWLPAVDPDAELASYEIRIDTDGEVLETWQQQLFVGPGTTSLALTAPLTVGTAYTYAVRARDARGALSPWSARETFTVTVPPPVTVSGQPAASLRAAIAAAMPGDVIMLGAGTYTLTETLRVGAGISIRGAGAGRTTLDASKLGVGISFDRSDASQRSSLDRVTVARADTCIQVADGATGVSLTHLIVRDCRVDGVAVRTGGAADVVNATLAGNGTAVRAAGTARIRNSLFTDNGIAAAGDAPAALASTYNNLFANRDNYVGAAAGTGDFSTAVTFIDFAARDLHLAGPQRSTDKGDPADDVAEEPAPNGGRINLGAFGGTADAEPTAPSTGVAGNGTTTPAGPTADPHQVPSAPTPGASQSSDDDAGCSVARSTAPAEPAALLVVLLSLLLAIARRHRAPCAIRSRRRSSK